MDLKILFSEEQIRDIVSSYVTEKKSLRDIMNKYNCSRYPIKRILLSRGVKLRKNTECTEERKKRLSEKSRLKLNEKQIYNIIQSYTIEGRSMYDISKANNCSVALISRILKENGVKIRKSEEFTDYRKKKFFESNTIKFDESQIRDIVYLYTIEKLSVVDIGKRYNCSEAPIERILLSKDIKLRISGDHITDEHRKRLKEALRRAYKEGRKISWNKKKLDKEQIDNVIRLYNIERKSTTEIGKTYGFSTSFICELLKINGVKLRTTGETNKGKHYPELSKAIRKLFAEGKLKRPKKITDNKVIDSMVSEYIKEHKTTKELSKKYGYGEWAIWKLLKDKGVSRTRADSVKIFPRYNKGKKGLFHHTPEEKLKISEASKKNWQIPDYKKRVGKSISKSRIGHIVKESTRLKLRESTLRMLSDPLYLEKQRKGRNMKPNKPEILLINLLDVLGLDYHYVGDYKIFIGTKGHKGHNPDFINERKKKVIEHFGDYYHGEGKLKIPKEKHEQEVIDHYRKHGYDCLIIWQYELKDLDKLKEKIQLFDKNASS